MVVAVKSARALAPSYDAIVVGSGYGGGVAASRLARMGLRVAVLEQGRRWRPGEFPTRAKDQRKITRITGCAPALGDPTGLYSLSIGKGITVFAATGLGGGSLINAGVTLRPEFERLRKAGWPSPVTDDGHFETGLARAEAMLGVMAVPEPERFAKYHGMCRAAEAAGTNATTPRMTIAHKPGVNAAGVMQYSCQFCGDCWSGCNTGAKTTVGITYIADAVDHGAEVFCEARVDGLAKVQVASQADGNDSGWRVTVQDLADTSVSRQVTSRILVLAAGSLGTTELLLRARDRGLPLSDQLGEKFSANGDDLVFATGLETPVNAIATGSPSRAPRHAPKVGPHSMALIDLGDEERPVWVHDGTMLSVIASIAPYKELARGKFGRAIRMLRGGIYGDEQSRTQTYYIVSRDNADGALELKNGRVHVNWPGYSSDPTRVAAEQKARTMIEAMGGAFQPNPFALGAFGGNRVIAHPLGGAGMGDTASDGVVAHDGRVFNPAGEGAAPHHAGLYVCDAAAIPGSVGVSPLLTISGLAERAMMRLAEREGRPLDVESVPAGRPLRDAAM